MNPKSSKLTIAALALLLVASSPNLATDGEPRAIRSKPEIGLVVASVDPGACLAPHPACGGGPPEAPAPSNAVPIRIVVQVGSVSQDALLGREAFDLRAQFVPEGAPPIGLLDCGPCFEVREGGTYALWVAPFEGTWLPGAYFFRIGLRDAPGVLPALARFDLPVGPPPPPPSTCDDNEPPVAVIAGSSSGIQASGFVGQNVNVALDGTLSFDAELFPLDDFHWSCGNGVIPQEQPPNGARAVCTYRVMSAAVTYTASLVVRDRGTGEIDPETGSYACQKNSQETRIAVTVSPLTTVSAEE